MAIKHICDVTGCDEEVLGERIKISGWGSYDLCKEHEMEMVELLRDMLHGSSTRFSSS